MKYPFKVEEEYPVIVQVAIKAGLTTEETTFLLALRHIFADMLFLPGQQNNEYGMLEVAHEGLESQAECMAKKLRESLMLARENLKGVKV